MMDGFVRMALVDMFGDVPYTEALQGSDNFNPAVTPSEDIYDAIEGLLDAAIASKSQSFLTNLPYW